MRAAAPLLTLLLIASPLVGQTTAEASAHLRVGEVLALRVLPGGGMAVSSTDGVYRELEGAVRLDITANRGWQLTVRTDPGAAVASLGGVAEPQRALWYRVGETAGAVSPSSVGYVSVEGVPMPVATGGAGSHILLDLDYRWLEAEGREAGPGVTLYFTLSPG